MTGVETAISVLLVGKQDSCLPKLKQCLDGLGIATSCVTGPSEADEKLRQSHPPELIFAAAEPADNAWMRIVEMAGHAGGPPVIVASRTADVKLYLDTLESGAADFVAAPFETRNLSFVVDTALGRSRLACSH
jgi:DNA-binding NtrC family response regulator